VASRGRWQHRLPETARVVAVEDIPAFWKAALFAGRRRKDGLGRSVGLSWASPHVGRRADDSGCPKGAEEGNVVAHAPPSVCTGSRPSSFCLPSGRRVLRSVLRPVRVDPHYARPVERRFVVGRSFRYHGWANPREWEEPALGSDERAQRGSPRVTASARMRAWHVREGRRSRPPSLRGLKSPGLSSARRVSIVAEVVRRRRTSNKLGKRAPKRAVRVE